MIYTLIFTIGGVLYGMAEYVWRGRTHWTMLICGGICVAVMYGITAAACPLWTKCLLSAAMICMVELVCGCIVNLRLGWHVWDYSSMALNFKGQICVPYALLWLALSVPAMIVMERIRVLTG